MIKEVRKLSYFLTLYDEKARIICLFIIAQSLLLIQPLLMGEFVDRLSVHKSSVWWVFSPLLCMGLFFVLGKMLTFVLEKLLLRSTREFESTLRLNIWRKAEHIPIGELEAYPQGLLFNKMNYSVSVISPLLRMIIESIVLAAVVAVIAIVIAVIKQPYILVAALLVIPLYLWSFKQFEQNIIEANHSVRTENESIFGFLMDMIDMLPLFRALAIEKIYEKLVSIRLTKFVQTIAVLDKVNLFFGTLIVILSEVYKYLLLLITGILCLHGIISVGDVVLYQILFIQITGSISQIIRTLPQFEMSIEAASSLLEIIDKDSLETANGKEIISKINGEVILRNVSFRYADNLPEVFVAIDFKINPREAIVVLGANGSGKSTLAKIIMGYFCPQQGDVCIDGHDLRNIQLSTLRKRISLVPQSVKVYTDSLLENIRLRDMSISSEQVEMILHACRLSRFLGRLSNGMDTIIDTHMLSGGEKQSIGIARALVRKPDIIIFDEITNNLDIIAMKAIVELLGTLVGKHTMVIITHHSELLAIATRVVALENGRIIEKPDDVITVSG